MKNFIYIITFISLFVMQVENAKCDESKLLSDSTKSQDTVKVENNLPDPDKFIEVEREPEINMRLFYSYIVYPELARKAGIEGRVVIRILVKKDGTIHKQFIESTDNTLLSESAMKAVNDFAKENKIAPAILKGNPVDCWLSIPISYKLKDKEETKQE